MSRNSDQEFLNDGFTEQIITNLSMLPKKKIVLVLVVYSAPSLFNESILD
jgi:TolB-like protein